MGCRLCQDVQYIHTVSPQGPYFIQENRYILGGTACISVYILLSSIFNLSWWKTNFYIHVCMFSILHGNNNDSFNTEDQFFFISNPDPNKLQRSSWLNLLVNIYLLHRLLWHGLLICYHQIKYELLIWC